MSVDVPICIYVVTGNMSVDVPISRR